MEGYGSCESDSSDVEIDEGVEEKLVCLLCERISSSTQTFFDHLNSEHNWNLLGETEASVAILNNQYSWIAFVNWARSTVLFDYLQIIYCLPGFHRMARLFGHKRKREATIFAAIFTRG